jgi:formamidopyrimidine-DNA glycosylase
VNGQLLLIDSASDGPSDPVVAMELDDGSRLLMQRIFMGHAHFLDADGASKRESTFGLDPLSDSFTPESLGQRLSKKPRVALKQMLMDQAIVAGIGNAYADEVLAAAHLHPQRPAGSLSTEDVERLTREVRTLLLESVSLGGDNDYTDLYGARGRFSTRVHNQASCQYCGATVQQTKTGGRTTYFCPDCQPVD